MTNQVEQKQFRRNYYTSDDSGKIYLLSLLVPMAVLILWLMLGRAICSMAEIKGDITTFLWFIIPYAILGQLTFLFTFIFYNKCTKTAFSAANVKKLSAKNVLICLLVTLIALFGIQFFVSTFDHILGLTGFNLEEGISSIPLTNVGWLFVYIAIYALLPAICEELIFRGVILTGLRRNFSDLTAVVLSAFMFALMHGSLQQLVYPFLLGLIFGLVVVRTGSTLASMIIHFSNNTLVIIFAYLQENCNFHLFDFQNTWWFYLLSFGLLILTAVLIYLIDKFYFNHKNQVENKVESDGTKGKISIFLWIGLAVAFVYLLFSIIMNFISPA